MPISIRGRRSKTEGWAVDIGEEVGTPSTREKLAANTPLWIICLIVVLFTSLALIASSGKHSAQDPVLMKPLIPGDVAVGDYTDEEHQVFVDKIIEMAKKRGISIEAEFLSDSEFKIVVPSDVGFDEIAYMSRFAALGIKRKFNIGAIIYAYSKSSKKPQSVELTATTQWSERELNFLTKPERAMEVENQ